MSPAKDPAASRPEALAAVRAFAQAQGLSVEEGNRAGELVVVLPGEQKLRTACSLIAGDWDLSLSAFVIRHPDENHERFYRHLLRRNLRIRGIAYAIDGDGDVFVVGRLPLAAVDDAQLDALFGAVLGAADSVFNDLLALGFLTSMKREWAWRTSRGESLRNLAAFRHLLEPVADAGPDGTPGGGPVDAPAAGGGDGSGPAPRGVDPA